MPPDDAVPIPASCYASGVTALLHRARELLEGHPELIAAYVFGSVGRGEDGPDSDVDVAVLLREPPGPMGLDAIRRDLERGLGREVDLVDLHRAPADLVV